MHGLITVGPPKIFARSAQNSFHGLTTLKMLPPPLHNFMYIYMVHMREVFAHVYFCKYGVKKIHKNEVLKH